MIFDFLIVYKLVDLSRDAKTKEGGAKNTSIIPRSPSFQGVEKMDPSQRE